MRAFWLLLPLLACTKADADSDAPVAEPDVATGRLELTPCDATFGPLRAGELASQAFRATNKGEATSELKQISVGEPFSKTASPVKVGPGAVYQFSVHFAPSTWGTFTSDLVLETDGGTIACPLVGLAPADEDGDGHDRIEAGGDDCDDADADIHAGAVEAWYDGVDADCDGKSDFDQDKDGYDSNVFNPDAATGGGDCQDANPTFHPGASDPVDAVDTDCDGTP